VRHGERGDYTVKRYTNSEIKARLVLVVGVALSLTFIFSIVAIIYGVTFVVQPLEVSPNDEAAWSSLSSILFILSGALTALLASNGLKDKEKDKADDEQ
jgi:uncharacterized BrkB/YihY/UPF0761 family membrane protein